jgi:glycosyltransferase involved in cell wall biosynthesis
LFSDRRTATLPPVTVVAPRVESRSTRIRRLGLAYPGDVRLAHTWSGTPSGLYRAFGELGLEVAPLAADPPRAVTFLASSAFALGRLPRTPGTTLRERLQTGKTIALFSGPELNGLRARALRRDLRRAGPLDAVVQIGTGFEVPAGERIATYEDLTVAQALRFPYPEWQGLSRREQAAAVERQRLAYERAAVCCFTSTWAAASAIDDYGIEPEKVVAVGVGRNHEARPTERDWTRTRFLFVGAEWKRKNGEAVLRAFAEVRRRVPDAELDLVGDHPQVHAPGVRCHGWLSMADPGERRRLEELFEAATCFVMPSLYEPSAIAYVEAAAAGLPIVGTTVGGSADLIGDGGILVDPTSDDELAAAMLELADPARARAMGAAAHAHSARFTWPLVARRILAALDAW